jgi:alpha-1,3-mannosyltransferase
MISETIKGETSSETKTWKMVFIYTMLFEIILNIILILYEPTYIFDWDAYMEEVYGAFHNYTFDYSKLKGDTGALVYPAGFVWLYTLFYKVFQWDYVHFTTEYPESRKNISGYDARTIRPAGRMYGIQVMHFVLYLMVLTLLFRIYRRTRNLPPYAFPLLVLSRRVHSIFVLGFFNDCFALFFFLLALDRYTLNKWFLGCVLYSLAVSIKMNILLFAPGLLYLLLKRFGLMKTIFPHLFVCAFVQIILALPFLIQYPLEYFKGAFNFGRKFIHMWSVNFQFLPENIFQSKIFSIGLILGQLFTLYLFNKYVWSRMENATVSLNTHANETVYVMLTANFIGIVFCRSLHYQFYVWYHFSIVYLLWQTKYATTIKFITLLAIEIAWNQHHPEAWSAVVLLVSHLSLLFGLFSKGFKSDNVWKGSRGD